MAALALQQEPFAVTQFLSLPLKSEVPAVFLTHWNGAVTQERNMPKPHISALVILILLILGSNSTAQTLPPAPPGGLRIVTALTVTLGSWRSTEPLTSFSPGGAHDSASVAWNGYLYVTGGQYGSVNAVDRIQRAQIQSDGSLGPWGDMATLTPPVTLPTGRQDHKATIYTPTQGGDTFIYIVAGWNNKALTDVYHAKLLTDGTLGPWSQGPSLSTQRQRA